MGLDMYLEARKAVYVGKFIDESNIAGDFRVTGSYKLTEASRLEENFDYTIPTEIVLPEKLDLETTKISIADFYYEIDSDVTMICYIDVKIEGVEIIEGGAFGNCKNLNGSLSLPSTLKKITGVNTFLFDK